MAQFSEKKKKTLTCKAEDDTVCMRGAQARARGTNTWLLCPRARLETAAQSWSQWRTKRKKKRTECDFSESHAHKMVPGGLVELFHQQTHHVT